MKVVSVHTHTHTQACKHCPLREAGKQGDGVEWSQLLHTAHHLLPRSWPQEGVTGGSGPWAFEEGEGKNHCQVFVVAEALAEIWLIHHWEQKPTPGTMAAVSSFSASEEKHSVCSSREDLCMRAPGEKESSPMYYKRKGLGFNRSAVPLLETGAGRKRMFKSSLGNRWLNNFRRHGVIGTCLHEGRGLVFLLRVSYSNINFLFLSGKYWLWYFPQWSKLSFVFQLREIDKGYLKQGFSVFSQAVGICVSVWKCVLNKGLWNK